jgi:hypothetical protein
MLSRELMGSALLALSWLTAVLVALDALIDVRAVRARLAEWKRSLVEATVETDALGVHEVEQRVKVFDAPVPTLGFFDRAHTSRLQGGTVRLGDELVEVVAAPHAEVWTSDEARAAAAACSSPAQFDELAARAKATTGALRTVRTPLGRGAKVWLVGVREGASFKASLAADFDPRTWARTRLVRLFGVMALDVAWVSVGTALALWPPVFGLVSVAGAVVLIGHFLGLTPIAMAVREWVRPPATAFLRGEWRRGT